MSNIPNYMQAVAEAIQNNNHKIREQRDDLGDNFREWRTRYWLIDPILKALGWDVNNPDEVKVEYPINGGFADYALLVPGQKNPFMIVEAKAIADSDIAYVIGEWQDAPENEGANWVEWAQKDIDQLKEYAAGLKQGYAVLTDGIAWCVWDLGEGNDLAQEKWCAHLWTLLDEKGQVYSDVIDAFKLLHRRNIQRGLG